MLTPKQLQTMPVYLVELYSELSEFVLSDIARRIAAGAAITDTAKYQMYRASALRLSAKEITDKVAEINKASVKEVEQLMLSAAKKSDEFERKVLKADNASDTEQLQRLCEAEIKNANGACRNLTGTLGFAQRGADGKVFYSSATDFLQKQMDMAQLKVASGTADLYSAVRHACISLAESGLRTVHYESGHSDRIEVAVRRAVMTSLSQVTLAISEHNAEEFGADGWEISAHSGARPSHAIYQGRQYAAKDFERIVRPLIDDYNCRHSAFPIILGVSEPTYSEDELKALDPSPFVFDGRRYTAYEAQQQMRKMERAMRKQKDRCIVADAAGDKDGFTTASIKLRRQKDIYEDFCEAAGSYSEYERTMVMGYDRHLSGKTGAVTRKQRAFDRAQITLDDKEYLKSLDKSGESGIMETRKADIVNGKNVVGIWKRRNSFDYAIDDIIDYQGYNGRPTIVYDRAEFDKYVEEDHFLAERTFCAETQATIDLYDSQLKAINGEDYFHVNCEAGGAQYGQGMYCAADYTKGTISYDRFEHEIDQYTWGRPYSKTNWMTLDPSAKVLEIPSGYDRTACLDYVTNLYQERYRAFRLEADSTLKEHWGDYQKSMEKIRPLYFGWDESDWNKADKLVEKLDKKYPDIRQLINDINNCAANKNSGILAAEMGYDAINAQGHGKTDSYTVVLNRTKLIIYGGENYEYNPK